jgi:hypothetical protein
MIGSFKTDFVKKNQANKQVHCVTKQRTFRKLVIFAFSLARQPQDVLLHRFPPVKPCANENFPYPTKTLKHNKREKRHLHKV